MTKRAANGAKLSMIDLDKMKSLWAQRKDLPDYDRAWPQYTDLPARTRRLMEEEIRLFQPRQIANPAGRTSADRLAEAAKKDMLVPVPARLETPGFMGDKSSAKVSDCTKLWLENDHT